MNNNTPPTLIDFVNGNLISLNDQPITLYPYQIEFLNHLHQHNKTINLLFRQSGKTVCIMLYALWTALFTPNSAILIVTATEAIKKSITQQFAGMVSGLPDEIGNMCTSCTPHRIEFNNGSSIKLQSASNCLCAIKGYTFTTILLDECAFYPSTFELVHITPALVTGGELHLISSWNHPNIFSKLWVDSRTGESSYHPFYATWHDHPTHDETWKDEIIRVLGPEVFANEYEPHDTGIL
jgi:hypothetical protein